MMSNDTSNDTNIVFSSKKVSGCYFNPFLSVVMVGVVGKKIDEEKKLIIKDLRSFERALPDEVATYLQSLNLDIWVNDDIAIKSTLTRPFQPVSFGVDNEHQIESLGELIRVLNMKNRISAPESIKFDDTASEKKCFCVLLTALMDNLFDKAPIRRIITGKKFDNPFARTPRNYYPINPAIASKYQDAWKQ